MFLSVCVSDHWQIFNDADPRYLCGESVLQHPSNRTAHSRDAHNALAVVYGHGKDATNGRIVMAVMLADERERLTLRYWLQTELHVAFVSCFIYSRLP